MQNRTLRLAENAFFSLTNAVSEFLSTIVVVPHKIGERLAAANDA